MPKNEYPTPPEAIPGVGLPLSHPSLHHALAPLLPGENPRDPDVRDWEGRINRIVDTSKWGRDNFGGRDRRLFNLEQNWWWLPTEDLVGEFTTDELMRAKTYKTCVMCDLSEMLAQNPHYTPLYKVGASLRQYGQGGLDPDYDDVVRSYRGLSRFDFGVSGFSTYLDHTDWQWGSEGNARYGTVRCVHGGKTYMTSEWLDGPFAYHVVSGSGAVAKTVLTIGFAFSDKGVMVGQVQLRGGMRSSNFPPPAGGRLWAHVIDRMRAAWPDLSVRLITGESQKAYNKYHHRKRPEDYPDELADRVAALYDKAPAGYAFGDAAKSHAGWGPPREYRELVPVELVPVEVTRAEPVVRLGADSDGRLVGGRRKRPDRDRTDRSSAAVGDLAAVTQDAAAG